MASIEINPRYEKAHARLGLSRFFLDYDLQGTIEAYEHALELDPTNVASKSCLGKAKQRLEEKMRQKGRGGGAKILGNNNKSCRRQWKSS